MKIHINNSLVIEDATPEVIALIKKELELPNPEYAKKKRMGFWTGNVPQTIRLYEYAGGKYILPFGMLRSVFKIAKDAEWIPEFRPAPEVDYGGTDVPLYDYQQVAVKEALASDFGILQSPAGSGKTQMGIAMIKAIGHRALWITHTLDLLKQSRDRAKLYIDEDMIGTISEGAVNISDGVTFATVQTLSKINLLKWRNYWDVIIIDEVQRCGGSPTSVTMFYKVLSNLSARHRYGLSATVHRADGMIKATYALVGEIVYAVPEDAVKDRIMQVGVQFVPTGTEITMDCLDTDGTLNYTSLINHLCTDPDRCQIIVDQIIENYGHSCLILSDRVGHLEKMMAMLPDDMFCDAVMINGKMTSKAGKAERNQAIEDMRTGKKKYLFSTYQLSKEGLDIPRLDRLFMTTPQKDYAVVTQSIGRIARTWPDKDDPIAYDFVDNIAFLVKAYKTRRGIYRKNRCWFVGE